MMFRLLVSVTITVAILMVTAVSRPRPAFAQGCPMCKTVAAAQSERATSALNRAIVLLLVPPVVIMSSILIFAFRRRNVPRQMTRASFPDREPISPNSG